MTKLARTMALLMALAAAEAAAAEPVIAIPSPAATGSALDRAEDLFARAQQGGLDDRLAEEAADLLADEDPFVRGIAEWALSARVNRDNSGQEIVWPQADPPAWYRRWMALDDDFLLDCDYVRQGAVWGIHHQASAMLGSLDKIIQRATGVIDEIDRGGAAGGSQHAGEQLARLHELRQQMAGRSGDLLALRRLWLQARRTARTIALANPAVDFQRLAYVQQHVALFANITGSQYPWSHKPGGDIWVQTGLEPAAERRPLLAGQLGPGHVHGIDLGWDADRAVFGYARQPDWPPPWDTISGDFVFLLRGHQPPTHLYEIDLDGRGLRQLTGDDYWSDFEPTWCADDSVVFASDRSGRSSECGKFSADHTVINLYRVFADGRIARLNDNKDIDRYPHSLDNGQIAYTRWEYQERHFLETHAIWSMRPEGTQADAVFNQHLTAPYALRDVRSVPGSPQLVAIASGHHTLAYGPIVLVDPRRGINNPDSLSIVTPRVSPQEGPMAGRPVARGGPPDRGGVYHAPWALSPTCFLAAYSYSSSKTADGFAIYLVDVHGNKELLARDRIYSCTFPMPVKRRPRPPQLPDLRADLARVTADASGLRPAGEATAGAEARQAAAAPGGGTATCYLGDVYQGLEGVPRGTIRYLRISQRVGWPLDERIGAMRYLPGDAWARQFGHWNWTPARVIGEVPVEEDGSACFVVPADTSVYFQALDQDRMEIRRMRSHVTLQAGETRGCVGCHESRLNTPRVEWTAALAMRHPPRIPEPPPWGAERLLGYEWLVQPILDKHCARCHDGPGSDGGVDLSGTPAADGFFQSFRTLFGRGSGDGSPAEPWIAVADRLSNAAVTQPLEFGSHRSRLIQLLRQDPLHRDEVQLSADDWRALVTWIDANAPYHDRFYNRRPANGQPPRRDVDLAGIGGDVDR